MNLRPSTAILSITDSLAGVRYAASIRRRLVTFVAIAALLTLGGMTYLGLEILRRTMGGDEDARLTNAAALSRQLVERVLAERSRQVDLIASSPNVVAAARKGGETARQKGLNKLALSVL